MQVIATNRIKIGPFVWELGHFKDNKVKTGMRHEILMEWNGMEWNALK